MLSQNLIRPLALFAALVQGYANPGSCSGACNVHDPSLIQRSSDNVSFRFSTGNKISYARSSSIKGPWTTVGSMLPDGSSIDLDGKYDLWVRHLKTGEEAKKIASKGNQ
jgi:arabinan endo-1,5-alpha-L-arabinosidase